MKGWDYMEPQRHNIYENLKTKEFAQKEYKEQCIEYINKRIDSLIQIRQTYIDINKEEFYSELIDELKKSYDVLCETERTLTISWKVCEGNAQRTNKDDTTG